MATTTVIYDNITFFLLQPVSSTSSPLRPEGADSPTVLSSQRMRMRGESADGQVGSRAQPPVEARARARPGSARPQQSPDPRPTQPATGAATPAVEEGPANAATEGQPRTRPSSRPRRPAAQWGRWRPEPHRGGHEHRPSATRRPGRFNHAFRRLRGQSATRPTHHGYATGPPGGSSPGRRHAEVSPQSRTE